MSRVDRAIGAGLLVLLLVLLSLAIAHRSDAAHSTLPVATNTRSAATPAGGTSTPTTASSPAASTPASVPPTTTAPPTSGPSPVTGPVSAVGDSIMLDIETYLQADIPGISVDGLVSRQFETGIGVVQAERAAGTLGRVLVVELGTNGTVTASDFDAMMQAASRVSRVVFVNVDVPRSWESPDNAVLAQGVARYPGVAVLADWYGLSSSHPEWFTADRVHLQPPGAQALAALVAQYA